MPRLVHFALASAAMVATAPLAAAPLTPKEIVERHTSSGGDLDKLMSDYADDAVVLQEGHAVQGKAAIRETFARMFAPPPIGAAPRPAAGAGPGDGGVSVDGGGMKVTRVWEEGDVGFMTWERGPTRATEEFIVRDGKIQVQTIFMSDGPPRPASPKG